MLKKINFPSQGEKQEQSGFDNDVRELAKATVDIIRGMNPGKFIPTGEELAKKLAEKKENQDE
ncbi:MAG: hypothetical protein ACKKL6_01085 [Candidatus Komeilibacteria bacterium]